MTEQVKEDCKILKIDVVNLCQMTMRDVISAYRKEALKVHPDKVSKDKESEEIAKSAMQTLNKAYENMLRYMNQQTESKDKLNESNEADIIRDDDETFMKDNFDNFNFPCENDGSFTVISNIVRLTRGKIVYRVFMENP